MKQNSTMAHKQVYLDYAALTPVCAQAREAVLAGMHFVGNPSALHHDGVMSAQALRSARERIAAAFGCKARELIFTGGLTEANHLAIVGHARFLEKTRRGLAGTHWLVSAIEHSSVLAAFQEVEYRGGTVEYIMPDDRGIIQPERVAHMLKPETVLVSVGWANNEIGVVQPLSRIADVVSAHEREHGTEVLVHSDAGQAPLYRSTLIHSLKVDMLSVGAHKLYGPHGIGALYVSNRTHIDSIVRGGGQERGLRGGTENVPAALGFAAAVEEMARTREEESQRVESLRDTLSRELSARIPNLVVNGDSQHSLPHMLNISIPHIQGEYVVLAMDHAGFSLSTKSACREGDNPRSHVVAALGGDDWRAKNTLRFSLGRATTEDDVLRAAEKLAAIVAKQLCMPQEQALRSI